MAKRGKLEIIKDILLTINKHHNSINITPLIRQSNMSSSRFREYYSELIEKEFVKETTRNRNKFVYLSEKGVKFLEKYKTLISFIDEFEL